MLLIFDKFRSPPRNLNHIIIAVQENQGQTFYLDKAHILGV
jgi:hypothetical protein